MMITRLLIALVLLGLPSQVYAQFPSQNISLPTFVIASTGVTGGGQVTSAQILCQDGTAAAPCYSFASAPTAGWYWNAGSSRLDIAIGGAFAAGFTSSTFVAPGTVLFGSAQDVSLSRGAANVLTLASGDMLSFGGVTNGVPLLKASGGALIQVRLGDDSGMGSISSGDYRLNSGNVLSISGTAPTVTSAGTSPSVVANGTAAFRVNVGTGGSATTIVMAMPAATTGWNCSAVNITGGAANRANQHIVQTASTTTSITVQQQTISTGAALAFTASDIVAFTCMAY